MRLPDIGHKINRARGDAFYLSVVNGLSRSILFQLPFHPISPLQSETNSIPGRWFTPVLGPKPAFQPGPKGEESNGTVQGIQIAGTAPLVNHLLFADDSLLFFKTSAENASCVQTSLANYCDASGHKVNLAKSSIFFSQGCVQEVRDEVKAITHIANESLNE